MNQPEKTPEMQAMDDLKAMTKPKCRPFVAGVNGFSTDPPSDSILVGDGAIRIGDIAMLNSGSGMGKSVAMTQIAMAWALGLPYFGIKPMRKIRILFYVGEDDEATMGQIREGFLKHSKAITGVQLTAQDLKSLDDMLLIQFDRCLIGSAFLESLRHEIQSHKPDLILLNPLLSYIGGDPVQLATSFLRGGLMPILAENKCASLISHHTCKLNRDSWANIDPTYSGIGGSEMANIPRCILTMIPMNGRMIRLQASKRTTMGWKDDQGMYRDHAYFCRTDDPTRPAWLHVSYSEGESASKDTGKSGKKKCTISDIVNSLQNGDKLKTSVIAEFKKSRCGESTVERAIRQALKDGEIFEYSENQSDARGGSPKKWLTLTPPPSKAEAGGQLSEPLT